METPVHIKLSELTRSIEKVISNSFSNKTFWVIGEISNLKFYPTKGYYFFDLVEKDENSNSVLTTLKATAWSSSIHKIRYFENVTGQQFDNNIQVLLNVTVEFHITYGLKLNLLDVDPSFTLGKLERQRYATLQRLITENASFIQFADGQYFTLNKSLTLPPVIQHIALIASDNSDGYKDFKHELQNNEHHYVFQIDEYLTQVQGSDSDLQMVKRLISIFMSNIKYDAVVIVRGGGSQSDFLAFDSYDLARAVAKFPIPIITGIGHTRNESITDMMAFQSTKTPTKVAASIIAHNRLFEERIMELKKSITSKANEFLAFNILSLEQVKATIQIKSNDILYFNSNEMSAARTLINELAMQKIIASNQALTRFTHELSNAALSLITTNDFRIKGYAQLVRHLSPEAVLKRGYALVYKDGKLITDASALELGADITTLLSSSTFRSTVTDKT